MALKIPPKGYFSSINQFVFLKQIGVGSFGSVKLALHVDTNKFYAIKIIDLTENLSENQLLILERQILLHLQIDHPHIIKLWDTLQDETFLYMIMEPAENGSLFSYQNKNGTLKESEAFKFFHQSLNAINYLHGNDIMHRDIKPQNILLDKSFNVKICDFGWATQKIFSKRKTFCGTYQYMAPEMAFEKQYDYRIDTWALGILLYQLLHGYAPFKAKVLEDIKQQISKGFYQIGKKFNPDIKALIINILQFQPQERPQLEDISKSEWVSRMKRQIRFQAMNLKNQLEGSGKSVEKKVSIFQKDQPHEGFTKKHRKFDSMGDQNLKNLKKDQDQNLNQVKIGFKNIKQVNTGQSTTASSRKMKKKCKTQGQQSLQKLLNPGLLSKIQMAESHSLSRAKKDIYSKQYKQNEVRIDFHKTQTSGKIRMRKFNQKIAERSQNSKLGAQKKKTRLKTQINGFSKMY